MKQAVCILTLFFATSSFGQEQAPTIQDPAQLVGKQVNVQRMPLCQPGTYTVDRAHAGKQATVVSLKPNKMMPPLSKGAMSRLTPEMRAVIEDQQKAATLLLQFEDGTKLDTCAPIGPKKLSNYLELVPGQTLAPVPQLNPNPAASPSVTATRSDGGNWRIVETKDPLTDARTVEFINRPSESSGRAIRMICDGKGHFRNLLFDSDQVLGRPDSGDDMTVYVRFDDGKIEMKFWSPSTDFRTLYAKSTVWGSYKGILKELLQARRVRVRYAVFGGTWTTDDYDVSGIDTQKLREYCGLP